MTSGCGISICFPNRIDTNQTCLTVGTDTKNQRAARGGLRLRILLRYNNPLLPQPCKTNQQERHATINKTYMRLYMFPTAARLDFRAGGTCKRIHRACVGTAHAQVMVLRMVFLIRATGGPSPAHHKTAHGIRKTRRPE